MGNFRCADLAKDAKAGYKMINARAETIAWIDALVNIKLTNAGADSEGQPEVDIRPNEDPRDIHNYQ